MLKIFMIATVVSATVFTAKADNDKPVSFDQLPANAKNFIRKYFDGQEISYAKMEQEFFDKSYEVFFTNGSKVEFDKRGNWDNVDCLKEEVPAGIVPSKIVDFVKKNHAGQIIVKIDRDRYDYEIELRNGIEITFDLNFNVIEYDD